MKDTIVINGIKIPVYQPAWAKDIVGMIDSENKLSILCPLGTKDEEIINYVKEKHNEIIFPVSEKKSKLVASSGNNKSVSKAKHIEQSPHKERKRSVSPRPTMTINNPWSVFSPIIPVIPDNKQEPRNDKSQIVSLVKNTRGYRIQYRYACMYCGNSHFKGYEYTNDYGRPIMICDFCRSEILQHKGWIHEISANIGGKK